MLDFLPSRTSIVIVATFALLGMGLRVLWLQNEVTRLQFEMEKQESAGHRAVAQAYLVQARAVDKAVEHERRRQDALVRRNEALSMKVKQSDDYTAPLDESLRVFLNGLSESAPAAGYPSVPAGSGVSVGARTDAH